MLGDMAPPLIRGLSAGWSKYYLKLHEIVYPEVLIGPNHKVEVKGEGCERSCTTTNLARPRQSSEVSQGSVPP
jgi:hypothetical protein